MFHVPHAARVRDGELGSTDAIGNNGAFALPSCEPGWTLILIASDEDGWEHVSVHAAKARTTVRTPSWREMAFVKDLYWDAEDVVVQFHPARSTYVNTHAHTLHLWRPIGVTLPTPPMEMV